MPYRHLLLRDHPVHQVADRNHSKHNTVLHHRKMPYAVLRDDSHTFAHRLLSRNRDHWTAHDLSHLGLLRRPPLQNHLACIVALGDDPDQYTGLHHQQRTHSFLRHHFNGLIHRSIRPRRCDLSIFLLQNRAHGRRKIGHQITSGLNTTSPAQHRATPRKTPSLP